MPPISPKSNPTTLPKEHFFVIMSGLISGTIIFSGQIFANLGLSLFEVSTLPFVGAVVMLLPFVLFNKKHSFITANLPLLLLYGFIFALCSLTQFAGLFFGVPVAVVVLLLYTQPFWTILTSVIILKEKVTSREIISVLLVLLGVFILLNPDNVSTLGQPLGLAIAILGGVALSGWVSVGSLLSKKGNDPVNSFFTGETLLLFFLILFYPILQSVTQDPSIIHFTFVWPLKIWLFLIIFSLVTQIVNHLFFLYGVKKVSAVKAGVIMLLEPVSGTLLAAIFLHQPITLNIIIGGLLILVANYLVIAQKRKETQVTRNS
ncbi:MAG TPA: DMT family transporter [Patescibacteria group bacterium]|nr:DMT family transporter [Patescibacteria group bacterium]